MLVFYDSVKVELFDRLFVLVLELVVLNGALKILLRCTVNLGKVLVIRE